MGGRSTSTCGTAIYLYGIMYSTKQQYYGWVSHIACWTVHCPLLRPLMKKHHTHSRRNILPTDHKGVTVSYHHKNWWIIFLSHFQQCSRCQRTRSGEQQLINPSGAPPPLQTLPLSRVINSDERNLMLLGSHAR